MQTLNCLEVPAHEKVLAESNPFSGLDSVLKELGELRNRLSESAALSVRKPAGQNGAESVPASEPKNKNFGIPKEIPLPEALRKQIEAVSESFSDDPSLYSTKHEKLLLKVEHIERMDSIRHAFNSNEFRKPKRKLTTSDIVNAALDFVLDHATFHNLGSADDVSKHVASQIYKTTVSRHKQFNEIF